MNPEYGEPQEPVAPTERILNGRIMSFIMLESEDPEEVRERDGIPKEVVGTRPMVIIDSPTDSFKNKSLSARSRRAPRYTGERS